MNAQNSKKEIYILKRSGQREPLDINKVHKMTEAACDGLTGVSSSLVEMNSGLQFSDGMTTSQIQEILIRSANDLITLEAPNYQYVAARLCCLQSEKKYLVNTLMEITKYHYNSQLVETLKKDCMIQTL